MFGVSVIDHLFLADLQIQQNTEFGDYKSDGLNDL